MAALSDDIGGYDAAAVTRWLEDNVPRLQPPFTWTRFTTGHSNLTFELEDSDGRQAVIRRPPLGELQPRAHDMSREYRIISALWPTPVPVPEPYAFCPDPDVTGAPFYVMGFVPGRALPNRQDLESVPGDRRALVSTSHIDALAELHRLDPDQIGLGELGAKEDYLGRQLRAWYRSWTSSAEAAGYDDPRVHELHDFLDRRKPAQGPARVAHGDYGLHNCLVGDDGHVAAVLDWEVATLGDPLADLVYLLNRWTGMPDLAGYLSPDELVKRYEEKSGTSVGNLDYYVAFNRWKSACIIHGVYTRYVRGQKSTAGVDLDGMRASIATLVSGAAEAAERVN
jgi:aminoglycoside phosphotransferase (APT) family kinase protein